MFYVVLQYHDDGTRFDYVYHDDGSMVVFNDEEKATEYVMSHNRGLPKPKFGCIPVEVNWG